MPGHRAHHRSVAGHRARAGGEIRDRGVDRAGRCARTTDVPLEPSIHAIPLDVLSDDSVGEAASAIAAGYPHIDMLINNAAVFPGEGDERLEDMRLEWFEEAFATNVVGVARVTRAFLTAAEKIRLRPHLQYFLRGGNDLGKNGFRLLPYSVSKAALNMLTARWRRSTGRRKSPSSPSARAG